MAPGPQHWPPADGAQPGPGVGGAEGARVCSGGSQSRGGLRRRGVQRVPWAQRAGPATQGVSKALHPALSWPYCLCTPSPSSGRPLRWGPSPGLAWLPPQSSLPSPQSDSRKASCFAAEWRAPWGYCPSGFPRIPALGPPSCQASPWAVLSPEAPQAPEEPLRPRAPCGPTPGAQGVGASVEGVGP